MLRTHREDHPILGDFRDYLQRLEDRMNSYRQWTADAERKDREAWQGLFRHLEEKIACYGWGHVPNASGGFEGFWWAWHRIPGYDGADAYLQVEASPGHPSRQHLCFKVDAGSDSAEVQNNLKQTWHEAIMKAGGVRVRRPPHMRRGRTMTVAIWGRDPDRPGWLIFGADGKLDIDQTLSCLKEAEAVLKNAVKPS